MMRRVPSATNAGPPAEGGRVASAARRWSKARDGVAAVEFALVLPVMVALLLGLASVSGGVNRDRKLVLLSRALADLASRVSSISTADMSDMFTAGTAILQPYSDSVASTQMVMSSIKVTKVGSNYTGSVLWSCGKNVPANGDATDLKARPLASSYPVPNGFTSDASFILVETLMPYTPGFGSVITGTLKLAETTPWPIRNADYVTLTGACPT